MPRGWSVQVHDWEALLSECADSWELGDTYADGPRQLLEDGSVIGTIAMHISQHEEVVAAAPSAVAEVIRLRKAITAVRDDYQRNAEVDSLLSQFSVAPLEPVFNDLADALTRILEGGRP